MHFLDGQAGGERLFCQVRQATIQFAIPLSNACWLIVLDDGSVCPVDERGSASPARWRLPSAPVFGGLHRNVPVVVCESGALVKLEADGTKETRINCTVAGGCMAGAVLVVLSSKAAAAPIVFNLEDEKLVPRMLSPGAPPLSAAYVFLGPGAAAGESLFTAIGVPLVAVSKSLVVWPSISAASLAIACHSDRPDAVQDAVQALAAQAVVHEKLKEQHKRASEALTELNQALQAKNKLIGSLEIAFGEDGSIGLRATIRNPSDVDLSSRWTVCVSWGGRRMYCVPLLRGVKKGSSAVVFFPDLVLDSFCTTQTKLWLVHSQPSPQADANGLPRVRFVAGRRLSVLLHTASFGALDLCWVSQRHAAVSRAVAPVIPLSLCRMHDVPRVREQQQPFMFRLMLNTEYLNGLASTNLDSAFGTTVYTRKNEFLYFLVLFFSSSSLVVRAVGGGGGLSEVQISVQSSLCEAIALRAALALRMASRLSETARAKNHDWRAHRAQLAALLQRLSEGDKEGDVLQIYTDLRRIAAAIL